MNLLRVRRIGIFLFPLRNLVAKIKSSHIGLAVTCNRGIDIVSDCQYRFTSLEFKIIGGYFKQTMEDSSGVRFPSAETKSKMYCSVYGCNSKACIDTTVRFHYFPKPNEIIIIKNDFGNNERVSRLKMWKQILKIGKEGSLTLYVSMLFTFQTIQLFFPR